MATITLNTQQLQMSSFTLSMLTREREFLQRASQDPTYMGKIKTHLVGRIFTLCVALLLHAEAVGRAAYVCFLCIKKSFAKTKEESSQLKQLLHQQKEECIAAYKMSLRSFAAVFYQKVLLEFPELDVKNLKKPGPKTNSDDSSRPSSSLQKKPVPSSQTEPASVDDDSTEPTVQHLLLSTDATSTGKPSNARPLKLSSLGKSNPAKTTSATTTPLKPKKAERKNSLPLPPRDHIRLPQKRWVSVNQEPHLSPNDIDNDFELDTDHTAPFSPNQQPQPSFPQNWDMDDVSPRFGTPDVADQQGTLDIDHPASLSPNQQQQTSSPGDWELEEKHSGHQDDDDDDWVTEVFELENVNDAEINKILAESHPKAHLATTTTTVTTISQRPPSSAPPEPASEPPKTV